MQTENRRPCKSWTLTQSSLKALNIISLQVDDHWLDPLWFLVALQWSSRGPGSFFIHISLLVQHSVCGFCRFSQMCKDRRSCQRGEGGGGRCRVTRTSSSTCIYPHSLFRNTKPLSQIWAAGTILCCSSAARHIKDSSQLFSGTPLGGRYSIWMHWLHESEGKESSVRSGMWKLNIF